MPRWIVFFGCLLTAIGVIVVLLGIVSPSSFFNDFPNLTQWTDISYVTTGWGLCNLGMGVTIALSLELPSVIGAVLP